MSKMPPQIVDLDDFTESMNIMCHADTGAGKTVLWSQLPGLLILAIEEGTISAKRRGSNAKVWRIHNWPELVKAYEWLRDNPGVFKWVMLDSITKAQSMCIKHIMEMVVKANPSRDPLIPAQGDHFKWQLSIKQLVTDFNELPENIVWLARSMVKENPEGDEIVVPLIEGKDYGISAWVCGEMHLLCYLQKERKGKGASAQMVRRLYTNEHPMYWCKDRYDVLPHIIESPDANKIVGMIEKSSGAKPATTSTRTAVKKAAVKKTTTRKRSSSRA